MAFGKDLQTMPFNTEKESSPEPEPEPDRFSNFMQLNFYVIHYLLSVIFIKITINHEIK